MTLNKTFHLFCTSPRVFFTTIVLLIALSSCSTQQETLLRIGINQWPGYETLYLARDLGFLDKKHIKINGLTSTTETLRAFKQGQIDVAGLTLDEALLLAQTEPDLRIFLVMDVSNGADKVMVRPDIKQLSDLKDKCIAAENTALGAYMLHKLLNAAKLNVTDVDIQTVTIDQHLQFMQGNQCSAVVTFDPMATRLAKKGFVSLFDSSQIPGKIIDVLVTRQSVIERRQHHLDELVSAQWQALEYIQQHQDDAYNKISPRLELSVAELTASYQGLVLPDKSYNQQLFDNNNSTSLYKTINELTSVLLEAKLIQKSHHAEFLLTDEFIK